MSNTIPIARTRPALLRCLTALVFACALLLAGSPALSHDHDSTRSGHPLRLIAYVVHPIGVVLDTLLVKPFHFMISYEPVQTLVGHVED